MPCIILKQIIFYKIGVSPTIKQGRVRQVHDTFSALSALKAFLSFSVGDSVHFTAKKQWRVNISPELTLLPRTLTFR